jgi:hypothetical protein
VVGFGACRFICIGSAAVSTGDAGWSLAICRATRWFRDGTPLQTKSHNGTSWVPFQHEDGLALVIALFLVTFQPWLALWLPNLVLPVK